jgi:hypothetical protein
MLVFLLCPVGKVTGREMLKDFDQLSHTRGFEGLITELYISNHQSMNNSTSHTTSLFNQAVSELYSNNPHLLQQQLLDENQEPHKETSLLKRLLHNRKKILNIIADWGPFMYFSYEFYKKYNLLQQEKLEAQTNQSFFQKTLQYVCPSIITSVPTNVSLFLTGAEFLIQAYLIKLLLKMIIFGFL